MADRDTDFSFSTQILPVMFVLWPFPSTTVHKFQLEGWYVKHIYIYISWHTGKGICQGSWCNGSLACIKPKGQFPTHKQQQKNKRRKRKKTKEEGRGKCNLSYEKEDVAFLLSLLPSHVDLERFCDAESSVQVYTVHSAVAGVAAGMEGRLAFLLQGVYSFHTAANQ